MFLLTALCCRSEFEKFLQMFWYSESWSLFFGIHCSNCESKLQTFQSHALSLTGLSIWYSKDNFQGSVPLIVTGNPSHIHVNPYHYSDREKNMIELNSHGGRTPRTFPTVQWGHGFGLSLLGPPQIMELYIWTHDEKTTSSLHWLVYSTELPPTCSILTEAAY